MSTSGSQEKSPKIRGPVYELAKVIRLANLAVIGEKVSEKTADALCCAPLLAQAHARTVLKALAPHNYAYSVKMSYAQADVYGIETAEGRWYVKFHMEHGRVHLDSCHPPEHQIPLANGDKIDCDII